MNGPELPITKIGKGTLYFTIILPPGVFTVESFDRYVFLVFINVYGTVRVYITVSGFSRRGCSGVNIDGTLHVIHIWIVAMARYDKVNIGSLYQVENIACVCKHITFPARHWNRQNVMMYRYYFYWFFAVFIESFFQNIEFSPAYPPVVAVAN